MAEWASNGVYVRSPDGDLSKSLVLEFNAFLKWIAEGRIDADSTVLSRVYTNGERKRAGDLKLFQRILSGEIHTETLLFGEEDGVTSRGRDAEVFRKSIEGESAEEAESFDAKTLLRAASATGVLAGELLRAGHAVSITSPSELLRVPEIPKAE